MRSDESSTKCWFVLIKKNVLLETEARQFMFEIVGVEIFSLNTKQFS